MVNDLIWDHGAISDFFDYDLSPYELEDEEGQLFRAADHRIRAEVVVLPVRRVIAFTLLDASTGQLVVDVSVLAHSRLDRRSMGGVDSLYCHECLVIPGIRAYRNLEWFSFFKYLRAGEPYLSVQFTCRPAVSLRFFDMAHENRAM